MVLPSKIDACAECTSIRLVGDEFTSLNRLAHKSDVNTSNQKRQ